MSATRPFGRLETRLRFVQCWMSAFFWLTYLCRRFFGYGNSRKIDFFLLLATFFALEIVDVSTPHPLRECHVFFLIRCYRFSQKNLLTFLFKKSKFSIFILINAFCHNVGIIFFSQTELTKKCKSLFMFD
jgi:hypothetical protein